MSANLSDERLRSLLLSYGSFENPDRGRILTAVLKNYARSVDAADRPRAERWKDAVRELTTDDLTPERVVTVSRRLGVDTAVVRIHSASPTLLADLGAAVAGVPPVAEPQLGVALAVHHIGLPPLLTYAFNAWQTDARSPLELGRRLGEVVVMGLFRLAEAQPSAGPVEASGAAADIVRSPHHRVRKVPRNYAARNVLLPQEHENFQRLAHAGLVDRIPGGARLEDDASLSREYVEGVDGEAMLRSGHELFPARVDDLSALYGRLQRVMADGGPVLDLHPANFVWSDRSEQWILIDLGPVPVIGSDEYRVPSFEDYFRHTWLDRMRREEAEPVRSLDYDVGLPPGDLGFGTAQVALHRRPSQSAASGAAASRSPSALTRSPE